MNKLYSTLRGNLRQYVMIIALVVVIIFFQIVTQGVLLKPLNISNIISQNSYVLILAIGMLLCILTGGNVDLSVGSVAGFVGAVSAVFILKMDMPVIWAILISLAIGMQSEPGRILDCIYGSSCIYCNPGWYADF